MQNKLMDVEWRRIDENIIEFIIEIEKYERRTWMFVRSSYWAEMTIFNVAIYVGLCFKLGLNEKNERLSRDF